MTTPNSGDVNPKPAPSPQDPNAGGKPNATPPAGANEPAVSGNQPANSGTVPIAALHEERDKRQALQAKTQALEEQVQQLTDLVASRTGPASPTTGAPQGPGGTVYDPNLNELWESDPRKAMQTELMMGLNWYDNVNTQLDAQEEKVIQKHPDFPKYRAEARKYLRTLPPQERAKPGVMELAYFVVKGQKTDSIVADHQKVLLDKIKAGDEIQGFTAGTTSTPANKPPVKATADQVKVAEAMGMTIEEYLKNVKV